MKLCLTVLLSILPFVTSADVLSDLNNGLSLEAAIKNASHNYSNIDDALTDIIKIIPELKKAGVKPIDAISSILDVFNLPAINKLTVFSYFAIEYELNHDEIEEILKTLGLDLIDIAGAGGAGIAADAILSEINRLKLNNQGGGVIINPGPDKPVSPF